MPLPTPYGDANAEQYRIPGPPVLPGGSNDYRRRYTQDPNGDIREMTEHLEGGSPLGGGGGWISRGTQITKAADVPGSPAWAARLMGMSGSASSAGGAAAGAAPAYQLPPPPTADAESVKRAQEAAFARSKDTVGRTGRASLDQLRDEFSSRGMGGSGLEGAATERLFEHGAGQLGDVSREQAVQQLDREQSVEDRNYAAQLAGSQLAYQGGLTARGQDISAENARRQSIMALVNHASFGRGLY